MGFFFINKIIYVFERSADEERIIAAFNFSDKIQEYELTVNNAGGLLCLLSSDDEMYGGDSKITGEQYKEVKDKKVKLKLPPFSGMYFKVM